MAYHARQSSLSIATLPRGVMTHVGLHELVCVLDDSTFLEAVHIWMPIQHILHGPDQHGTKGTSP